LKEATDKDNDAKTLEIRIGKNAVNRVANSTIRRLSIYLRLLETLQDEGVETVSSERLSELAVIKATQLRKDLSFFGSFGVRGRGYNVEALATTVRSLLGLDQERRAVLIGAGSLGRALAGYKGFERHNIRIAALLDTDPALVGRRVAGIVVEPVEDLAAVRTRTGAEIAVIAAPAGVAQEIGHAAVAAGFRGLVNFAPVRLVVPDSIAIYSVDLSIAFEHVIFRLHGEKETAERMMALENGDESRGDAGD
jgi:redox-sensing transcriptional repressor